MPHPPADRAAILREAAALLDQRATALDAFSSSDGREEARAVRELADVANELRRLADEAQPVQHAPGKAILCPGCRDKGRAVCLADEAQQPAPADADSLATILRIVADWHHGSEGGDVLIEELAQAGFRLPAAEVTP